MESTKANVPSAVERWSPVALLLALVAWSPACGDEPLPATGELSTEPFRSDVVDDDYLLRLRLPPGYTEDATPGYPLVVQLDPTFVGLKQYDITVGFVSHYAARGEWPETIVVGVDYPGSSERDRDYLPPEPLSPTFDGDGADRFYRVLRDEILPHLEARYAIDPGRRYLLGHSNGGIFAWYAAFRHDTAVGPPLFAGVVAADCGHPEELFTYERWHADRSADLPMRIFTTRAVANGATLKITFDALIERLGERGYPGLVLDTAVLETDHGGAIWPSYKRGLAHLLGGAQ
jgi:hypothetical protein